MNKCCLQVHNPATQRGSLMVATLLILLVISLLGMASVDSTGLEMKMSSNSRVQQQVFEAAEYTLSWVENNIQAGGYFTNPQLSNSSCGAVCFTSTCTGGYCFSGTNAINAPSAGSPCALAAYTTEPSADSALWTTGSGKYKTLVIPGTGITTKYIIEYRCWTAKATGALMLPNNYTHMFRITTLATGEDGRSRVMLRSSVRQP